MITIAIIAIAIGLVVAATYTIASIDAEVATSAAFPFGVLTGPQRTVRPRGVQEEDLPPFVFRDRPAPVHAPSSTPVRLGQLAPIGG